MDHLSYGDFVKMKNEDFDWEKFFIKEEEEDCPYKIHFIFGLKIQTESFSFVHYLSIYSAFIMNEYATIYLHHHFPIHGYWWERLLQDVPNIILNAIGVPTHIGAKKIIKLAHKADKARMDILWEMGGIYMDIDTISHKSMKPFLKNETTLCKQYNLRVISKDYSTRFVGGICNAIMITKQKSKFFKKWLSAYERAFDPTKWEEASIWLPLRLSKEYPQHVNVLDPEVFNVPCCWEGNKMFEESCEMIPNELVVLHMSETMSKRYIDQIKGWEWIESHKETLYATIAHKFKFECIISNNCYGKQYYKSKNIAYKSPFIGLYINAPCYIKLLENCEEYMKLSPKPSYVSKYGEVKQGCIATINDDVEIHFWHESNIEIAIEKWEKRKKRMLPMTECIVKFCDRDNFQDDFVKRYDDLIGFGEKKLMLSNSRHHFKKKVNASTTTSSTTVYKVGVDNMIDGIQLEKYISV